MDTFINFLFQHWQRKAIALVAAIIVWVYVNQSITEVKTIPNVPVRILNIPDDKTISGLMPNSYLSNRITLTLTGAKDIIHELDRGDLEVQLDASLADSENWVVQINRKNLVSLNPSLDLKNTVSDVSHPEFVVQMSDLVAEKIPIYIVKPQGVPPNGYEFLDIWPEKLTQTLSGPKEAIHNLKLKGLKLVLDMSRIDQKDLDRLREIKKNHNDEVSFVVPEKWKWIPIPFKNQMLQEINDPEAKKLRIHFLKKELLPLGIKVPIAIFYPSKFLSQINPETHLLIEGPFIEYQNGIPFLTEPLYVKDVSSLFLDIVKESIEIVLIASPKEEREHLQWSIEVIDTREMEDTYVAYNLAQQTTHYSDSLKKEEALRKRFRRYMQKLTLYTASGKKFTLSPVLKENSIHLREL